MAFQVGAVYIKQKKEIVDCMCSQYLTYNFEIQEVLKAESFSLIH